ncbi:MAG: hypothetical protein II288_04230 [Alistipes sp.]|jgi:nucleoside phosphorylase|nr:hypothetical protein [Alistipes sp.]
MTIFLFPTELEAAKFRRLQPSERVVISGVGMAATAATLSRLHREYGLGAGDTVVLSGIAGSYDAEIAVGSVVEVVEECCVELPERFRCSYRVAPATSLRGVRANSVHRTFEAPTDAQVENMEGAALFAMAEALGFRAVEIRAISNMVADEFVAWNIDLATSNLAEELLRLYP